MSRMLRAGLTLFVALLLLVTIAPGSGDPLRLDLQQVWSPPSAQHWIGTDNLGRDLWSRVLLGGRFSLGAGLAAASSAAAMAVLFAAASLLSTRRLKLIVDGGAGSVQSIPAFLGAMAVAAVVRDRWPAAPEWLTLGIVIGAFAWPPTYRVLVAELRRLWTSPMALAARAAGVPDRRLMVLHLIPAAALPALVPLAFMASGAMLIESGLGFLGLGVQPPTPSWGNLLAEAWGDGSFRWWGVAAPGVAIFLVSTAFAWIGHGLSEELSPQRSQ